MEDSNAQAQAADLCASDAGAVPLEMDTLNAWQAIAAQASACCCYNQAAMSFQNFSDIHHGNVVARCVTSQGLGKNARTA